MKKTETTYKCNTCNEVIDDGSGIQEVCIEYIETDTPGVEEECTTVDLDFCNFTCFCKWFNEHIAGKKVTSIEKTL